MFTAELEDAVILLVVVQRPFEIESAGGISNAFSSFKPILHEDGRPAHDEEFPDDGYVWWMLRPKTRVLAEPGRILMGKLEKAKRAEIPGKSWYQVQVESVEPVRTEMLVEVLEAPPGWISEPIEIISRQRFLVVDHPPLDQVYLTGRAICTGPSGRPARRKAIPASTRSALPRLPDAPGRAEDPRTGPAAPCRPTAAIASASMCR